MNVTGRRPFSELGDQQLLEQTRRLAANQRCLEVHILDHLDEIDRRGLALRRGFSSLFDYTSIRSICKYYNGLPTTRVPRYCFRNPLVESDHPWFAAVCAERPKSRTAPWVSKFRRINSPELLPAVAAGQQYHDGLTPGGRLLICLICLHPIDETSHLPPSSLDVICPTHIIIGNKPHRRKDMMRVALTIVMLLVVVVPSVAIEDSALHSKGLLHQIDSLIATDCSVLASDIQTGAFASILTPCTQEITNAVIVRAASLFEIREFRVALYSFTLHYLHRYIEGEGYCVTVLNRSMITLQAKKHTTCSREVSEKDWELSNVCDWIAGLCGITPAVSAYSATVGYWLDKERMHTLTLHLNQDARVTSVHLSGISGGERLSINISAP